MCLSPNNSGLGGAFHQTATDFEIMMKVMIFSLEHDAWWRPNSHGYSREQSEAGLYDEEEAVAIVRQANGSWWRRKEVLVRQFNDSGVMEDE